MDETRPRREPADQLEQRALALAPSWYVDALPAEPVQPPLTGRVHADVADALLEVVQATFGR